MLRKGHELGSKRPKEWHPSAEEVAEAERMAALAERLPVVLRGEEMPKENVERLDFAQMAHDTAHHAAAARLRGEAMEADSKIAESRRPQRRYNAACDAALAAAGQGKDVPAEDDMKAGLRERARGWLTDEVAAWTAVLDRDGLPDAARKQVARTLRHWRTDADLAGVREAEALDKLPEAERGAWQALWAEVAALLTKAGAP